MDPRYNWPPQAYGNGQYNPYAPPQQPNGYQQHGYPPQYPQMQMQMQMPQAYPPTQPHQGHPQGMIPPQAYQPMPPQMHAPQQPQPQPRPRAQPQVVIPARAPSSSMPMQMQPPKIRHVQIPVQRTSSASIVQTDGAADQHRPYRPQQAASPASSKPVQRSQSDQENAPRPQQRTVTTPVQNVDLNRGPVKPQATTQTTPRPRVQSISQTPSSQSRSSSVQQSSSKPKSHPQVVIPRSSSHQLTPTKHAPTPKKALPADLSVMLLSAADEYLAAARAMGSLVVREKKEADLGHYYKLMATAMGCMDTVLKDFSMMPRDEAKLRLRYASLLIEETDNTTDIDEVLSKQIQLCGRCRLNDLKYATFHLQARYQFKTNHRAGLKSLDKPISEAETFQHIIWVYALRFLKVSLILQIPGRVEAVPALQQLHAILAHAEKRGDRAVFVACSALEAMVHLRSGAPDRLEQAQRAIAAARSLQLQVSAKQLGSFGTLIDIIDIACGIQQATPDNKKSTALLESVFKQSEAGGNLEDGIFTVLLERSFGKDLTMDTGGVFRKSTDGRDELVFAWLPKEDLKTLCFHISALDHNLHEKGMIYIKEAHQRSKGFLKRQQSQGIPISLTVAQLKWNAELDWHSIFTMGLLACFREDYATVQGALNKLRNRSTKLPQDSQGAFKLSVSYLSALSDQKKGFFDSALDIYSSDALSLLDKGSASDSKADIKILATLNRLLILRNSSHPQHHTASALLAQVQPFSENHPNQYIRMAFRIVQAISSGDLAINRQKTLTQMASNRANEMFRTTQNREFVLMALSYFTMRFFAGQVNDKAIQAVRATRQNARASRRPLWMAVAYGLCIETYQRHGLVAEVQQAWQEFEAIRSQLHPALIGEEGEDVDAEGEDDI